MKIYFDSAATAPIAPEIYEKMRPFFFDNFANPSGFHEFARRAKTALNSAREKVAEILNAKFDEIIFTSGGTESDNLAIRGAVNFAAENLKNSRKKILTTAVEHPAVLQTVKNLPPEFQTKILPVDRAGFLNPEIFAKNCDEKTLLASIIFTNNEIGTTNPIAKLAEIAREKNVIFHTDACQSAGILKINLRKIPVDFLSLNSAKIGGPRGVGILFRRKNVKIKPLFFGGEHEFGLRPGTENVAGAVGFVAAFEVAQKNLAENRARLLNLQKKICDFIFSEIPAVRLNGAPVGESRSFLNLNFSFLNCEGESLLLLLDEMGFAVATGSACASEKLEISPVLAAINLPHGIAHGSLRISFSAKTTADEIEKFLPALKIAVEKIRKISSMNLTAADFPEWFD